LATTTRWTIAVLVVVVALIVALALQLRARSPLPAPLPATTSADAEPSLADLRSRAALAPCPSGTDAGPAELRGIVLHCAGDGSDVDVARMVGGRTLLLNIWAYWCEPCRTELPAMAEYQRRAGPAVTVVTVHGDPKEAAGLQLLADLGVRLPTVQDGDRRIVAALKVPNVMPATVLLRANGSVAATMPRAFASADDIASAVKDKLGVPQ
jgi:thiol-disulfide isomerase/thioredoxin